MPTLFASSSRFVDVILPLNMQQTLTYGIPADNDQLLLPGMRVEVALGRNKKYAGIVTRLHDEPPEGVYEVKPILNIIDNTPIVNEYQLRFWQWIADYYAAVPGEVMQAALPAHLKLSGETRLQWAPVSEEFAHEWSYDATPVIDLLMTRKQLTLSDVRAIVGNRKLNAVIRELIENQAVIINDALEPAYKRKIEKYVRLNQVYTEHGKLEQLFIELVRAPKQMDLLMHFVQMGGQKGDVSQQELLNVSKANATILKALVEKDVFEIEERDTDRIYYNQNETLKAITFSPAQQIAYDQLNETLAKKNVVLLQGVTGSGKTLLYIEQIRACLAAGKQALFLLPEIGLTTQLVSRLYNYFGEELGVYHSRFSNNERVEIWEKVQSGKFKVVVGARSAIWLPFNDLGVIIADEEHDPSYKQRDPAPRFHARDAAIFLGSLHKAKVILGSATPSVETLYNAHKEKYGWVKLTERYLGVEMPEIQIVDARTLQISKKEGYELLSPSLQIATQEALFAKKQVIFFQNRRGYSPFQLCVMCGHVPQCNNCSVSLTFHKSTDKLHCHYCGTTQPIIKHCPQCGSTQIISRSFGTEKIEEEAIKAFPTARVARMDVDSMRGKNNLTILLEKMEKQEIDILVGTQMVVKGLDFAPVSLVAILNADSLLSYPDFRVNERAYQLMEQVSGRAGRADGKGKVIIQAHNLTHPVLRWVCEHNVDDYYNHEIGSRAHYHFPPFVRIIKITFRHKNEQQAIDGAMQMLEALQETALNIGINGPVPGIVARVRNLYVYELWLKCPLATQQLAIIKNNLRQLRTKLISTKGNGGLDVVIDVDPV